MNKLIIVNALMLIVALGCSSSQKPVEPAPPLEAKVTPKPAPESASKPSVAADEQKFSCTKAKDSRLLEVTKKGAGCALNYTKGGKDSEVASSKHGLRHCEKAREKIKGTLEKAGFECKAG